MTPLEIKICLHYAIGSMEDHPWFSSGAPVVEEVRGKLIADGLLAEVFSPGVGVGIGGGGAGRGQRPLEGTPKLKAYVDMLTGTPLPERAEQWVDPRFKK